MAVHCEGEAAPLRGGLLVGAGGIFCSVRRQKIDDASGGDASRGGVPKGGGGETGAAATAAAKKPLTYLGVIVVCVTFTQLSRSSTRAHARPVAAGKRFTFGMQVLPARHRTRSLTLHRFFC